MELWLKTSLMLCCFGFFREMRPSQPFAIEFLNGWFNMTSEQATKEVYPLATYFMLAELVIIFLITDMLRYKPIIVVSACSGIIMFALCIWTTEVIYLQIVQLFFATCVASEVAYYTYIYAKVDKERYQMVTGQVRAAILCGKFTGGILGQLLISTGATGIRPLYYISLGTQVVSLIIAVALPKVGKSLYFYSEQEKIEDQQATGDGEKVEKKNDELTVAALNVNTITAKDNATTTRENDTAKIKAAAKPQFSWHNACRLLLQHTVSAYSKPVVVKWSAWWAVAASAEVIILTYVQFLWIEIDPNHENFYNGAVEAIVTLLGAVGAIAAGMMSSKRHKKWHWLILTIASVIMGICLMTSALTHQIIVAYVMYILYGLIYFFVITIASATVAENLADDSYGLIFGINTFFALVLQTLLTVFVLTDVGFGLGPRDQFVVFGGYYIVFAVLFCMASLVEFLVKYRHKAKYILRKAELS